MPKRDILLINPSICELFSEPPFGIFSLYSYLNKKRISCEILDLNYWFFHKGRPDYENFLDTVVRKIIKKDIPVLGFLTLVNNYTLAINIAKKCKQKNPKLIVIFGGPQATFTDIETLKRFSFVDIIVRGEGEETLVELIERIKKGCELHLIQGITLRKQGKIIRTANRELISDLDSLPIIDYKEIQKNHPSYILSDFTVANIEIGRGCVFNCSFCCTNQFWGREYRMKSPERVIYEIKETKKFFTKIKTINFIHDSPTINKSYMEELCKEIISTRTNVKWTISSRVEFLDRKILRLFKQAGCTSIYIGVESAVPKIQEIYNKKASIKKLFKIVRIANKNKIKLTISFIIGHPYEKNEDMVKTFELILMLSSKGVKYFSLGLLCPYPGSTISNRFKDYIRLRPTTIEMQFSEDKKLVKKYPSLFCGSYILKSKYDTMFIKKYMVAYGIFLTTFRHFPKTMLYLLKKAKLLELMQSYVSYIGKLLKFVEDNFLDDKYRFKTMIRGINYVCFPKFIGNISNSLDYQKNIKRHYKDEMRKFLKFGL